MKLVQKIIALWHIKYTLGLYDNLDKYMVYSEL